MVSTREVSAARTEVVPPTVVGGFEVHEILDRRRFPKNLRGC
jgi:hypothetical protein